MYDIILKAYKCIVHLQQTTNGWIERFRIRPVLDLQGIIKGILNFLLIELQEIVDIFLW